jgi:hypothetical protein
LKYFLTNPREKCDNEFEKWKDPLKTEPSLFSEFKVEENDEGN